MTAGRVELCLIWTSSCKKALKQYVPPTREVLLSDSIPFIATSVSVHIFYSFWLYSFPKYLYQHMNSYIKPVSSEYMKEKKKERKRKEKRKPIVILLRR